MHVVGVVRVKLVDEDLLRKLNGQSAAVDGDLLHQLTAFYSHCERKLGKNSRKQRQRKRIVSIYEFSNTLYYFIMLSEDDENLDIMDIHFVFNSKKYKLC